MPDNRLQKSLEEAYINNDAQYNFGGWVPPVIFDTPSPTPSPTTSLTPTPTTTPTPTPTPSIVDTNFLLTQILDILQTSEGDNIAYVI